MPPRRSVHATAWPDAASVGVMRGSARAAVMVALVLAVGGVPVRAAAAEQAREAAAPATAAPTAKAAKAQAARKAQDAQEAPADAAAVAEPVLDPLERLRQRLADPLARSGAELSGALELKVRPRRTPSAGGGVRPVAHGSPAAAPSADHLQASARSHAARVSTPAAATPAAAVPVSWGYEGAGGPEAWGALKPEFGLCAKGRRQSPIDIRGGLAVDLEPVRFDYRPSAFGVVDNGRTVQVSLQPGNAIEVAGRRFELVQFHFHRPSEERIDGRQFAMSLHLVHRDEQGRHAVVALLLDEGPAHPVVQAVWNHLPLERHDERRARVLLDPTELLPADRRYYTYMGSLTMPPCTEDVLWVVMRTPVSVAAGQIELFSRIYPMNARPLQSASGRRILQSQ